MNYQNYKTLLNKMISGIYFKANNLNEFEKELNNLKYLNNVNIRDIFNLINTESYYDNIIYDDIKEILKPININYLKKIRWLLYPNINISNNLLKDFEDFLEKKPKISLVKSKTCLIASPPLISYEVFNILHITYVSLIINSNIYILNNCFKIQYVESTNIRF